MKLKPPSGVFTALVTPFQANGEIDWAAFDRLLDAQERGGVDGVVPCGTTGEAPTLTVEEKREIISRTIARFKPEGRIQVYAGTGTNDTRDTVELSSWAAAQGADGCLVVTPYYNRPSQRGLREHFEAVANAMGSAQLMLYNVPGRTGVALQTETVVALAKHPAITSIKEASGQVTQVSELIDRLREARARLSVLSGDDALFLPSLALGAVGVVSVASNAAPRAVRALYLAHTKGEPKKAATLNQSLYPLFRDLFIESNPGPIKALLHERGKMLDTLRAPLVPPSKDSIKQLLRSARGIRA